MRRREFLRATLVSAGAVLVGCGTDSKATPHADAATGSDSSDAGVTDTADAGAPPLDGTAYFPQSLASGDPRPDGAVLWTRAFDAAQASADLDLTLQVATDEQFQNLVVLDGKSGKVVPARAAQDHCVKVRVAGLASGKLWYYRFLLVIGGKTYTSHTGRFKTAPAAEADVPVQFAVASCQDYSGKYYNSYARLLLEPLDFFVHLGDYVYETTGNPSFQDATAARKVTFTDTAGAIAFGAGTPEVFYAAQSLSNYRELYKTYRSDADLQRVHESLAMIAIGDDHEFSDDCWGANATYFNGAQNENDEFTRRGAADQAWFEYMPVDFPIGPDFAFDPKAKFPENLRAYRDFGYGKHVHLLMTDLRRYRSDHLIPEDALPGAVLMTEAELMAATGNTLPEGTLPYFDSGAADGAKYAKVLKDHATDLKLDAPHILGLLSATWVNARLDELDKAKVANLPAKFTDTELAAMPHGYAVHQLLKNAQFTSLGSRYLVTRKIFETYAKARWLATSGASEHAMGDAQEKWFLDTLHASARTWKLWGSEYTFQRRIADLSAFKSLPAAFKTEFVLSAEDWDGMPNRREKLLQDLAAVPNTVVLSGDIHAFFAGTPTAEADPKHKIVEFVGGAISSSTYQTLLFRQASSDPTLVDAGAPALALLAGDLLTGKVPGAAPANPHLAYAAVDQQGFTKVVADANTLNVTFYQTAEGTASARLADDQVQKAFQAVEFQVKAGAADLYQRLGGAWKKWDPATNAWV
jgi:alkaline phosphatase D